MGESASSAVSSSSPCRRKLPTGALTSKSCCVRSNKEGISVVSGSRREMEFFRIKFLLAILSFSKVFWILFWLRRSRSNRRSGAESSSILSSCTKIKIVLVFFNTNKKKKIHYCKYREN